MRRGALGTDVGQADPRTTIMKRIHWLVEALLVATGLVVPASGYARQELRSAQDWTQFAGPGGAFSVHSTGLADAWPADGPPQLWSRDLGEGDASIVVADGRLFTLLREGSDEVIVSLDAGDGATLWEHRCEATPYPEQTTQYGAGPHATPLLLGERLFTIGFTGILHCLNAADGRVLWTLDLVGDLGGPVQYYGHSSSPIAHDGKVIVLVGGPEHGVLALDPIDGSAAWASETGVPGYATPIVIDVDGQDQLVFFTTEEVVGLDPRDGTRLWSHPVLNNCRTNCSSVVWGEDNLLWVASKGISAARVLRLSRTADGTSVEEVWLNRRLSVYHWNAVRVGDRIYASIGDSGSLFAVVDVRTGEVVEKRRGSASTNSLFADGKLIQLDAEGQLSLARPVASGLAISSSFQLFAGVSWTVPTLVGQTLYARDRERIVALDLGRIRDGSAVTER